MLILPPVNIMSVKASRRRAMILSAVFLYSALAVICVTATPIIYDGRAPLNLKSSDLDASSGPYLTGVKGKNNTASHYTKLTRLVPPTPLWNPLLLLPHEQTLSISIDNSSVFVPGSNPPQYGFRRTELIAQRTGGGLNDQMENGTTIFHFSIKANLLKPLNLKHEYQIVFIEPNDGTHVFGVQLGSPFTNPTGPLPAPKASHFKVLDHALNVLFSAPFAPLSWHNFAVQVDWDQRTLAVLYSTDGHKLRPVTGIKPNPSAKPIPEGRGDYHFGLLKLPLVNPNDTPEHQGDVVNHGLQEGTTEGLLYSGVFVEKVDKGISVGGDTFIPRIV